MLLLFHSLSLIPEEEKDEEQETTHSSLTSQYICVNGKQDARKTQTHTHTYTVLKAEEKRLKAHPSTLISISVPISMVK